MGLGLNTEMGGGGDFAPLVKYDARAGRFFRADRTEGPGGWETSNVDITQGFKAIFDLENIQVGWAAFRAGMAPEFRLVPLGAALPPRPEGMVSDGKGGTKPAFQQAFKVMLKLAKTCGGDVRELASTAKAAVGAVDLLHSAYEAQKADHPGQLPVVAMTGSTPIKSSGKGQTSTNYAPIFEIVSWVDRPADLKAPKPPATPAPASNVASYSAARSAGPVTQMKATSQVVADTGEEF